MSEDDPGGFGDLITPVDDFDVALLDLDGVVYVGDFAVDHAVPAIRQASEQGMRAAYVTNNASRTPEEVATHLCELGLEVSASDVVTSAQAGAHALQRLLQERGTRGRVLAVGGPGVAAALNERGLDVTHSAQDHPVGVLQGFGRDVGWSDLAEASIAVGRGAVWVATNPDVSIPTPRGRAPGNGAFVQAVGLATGRSPDLVAGKPHRPLIDESLDRTGARRALMVGDRLDTDIEAGVTASLTTFLVMTGVTDVMDILLAPAHRRPDLISLDLRGLHDAFPPVIAHPGGSPGVASEEWRCGPVRVVRGGQHIGDLTLSAVADTPVVADVVVDDAMLIESAGWSAAMRAFAAAVWNHRDRVGARHSDAVDEQLLRESPAVRALQSRVARTRGGIGE